MLSRLFSFFSSKENDDLAFLESKVQAVRGNNKYQILSIEAIASVKFSIIDKRIIDDGAWAQCYPRRTTIAIPIENALEIIQKLKQHPEITCVGNEQTSKGIEVQTQLRQMFSSSLSR